MPSPSSLDLADVGSLFEHDDVIITHATNRAGKARIFLGGRGSVDAYIDPDTNGRTWSFHIKPAPAACELPPDAMRAWAVHTLMELAKALDVAPEHLKDVPFECIAALHVPNPFENCRMRAPRRQPDNGYMAIEPGLSRPATDFRSSEFAKYRTRSR